jgi:putative flippase GtrA
MKPKHLLADALRFLVFGAINTAVTSAIYIWGLTVFPPTLSYAIAWLVGIVFVVTVYPSIVFPGGHGSLIDRSGIGMVTIVVFLIGLVVLHFLTKSLGDIPAFVVTLALTMFLNFSLSRLIMRRS